MVRAAGSGPGQTPGTGAMTAWNYEMRTAGNWAAVTRFP